MTDRKAFLVRLDPALHDALRRWADDDLRSLNAQIEFLLRRALADAGRLRAGGKGGARDSEGRGEQAGARPAAERDES